MEEIVISSATEESANLKKEKKRVKRKAKKKVKKKERKKERKKEKKMERKKAKRKVKKRGKKMEEEQQAAKIYALTVRPKKSAKKLSAVPKENHATTKETVPLAVQLRRSNVSLLQKEDPMEEATLEKEVEKEEDLRVREIDKVKCYKFTQCFHFSWCPFSIFGSNRPLKFPFISHLAP